MLTGVHMYRSISRLLSECVVLYTLYMLEITMYNCIIIIVTLLIVCKVYLRIQNLTPAVTDECFVVGEVL